MTRAFFVVALLIATLSNISFVWNYGHLLSCWNLGIDTELYDQMSRQLLQTRSLSAIPPSQPLGFIVALAGLYGLFGGSVLAAKITFCLMTAATAIGAWHFTVRFVGEMEGAIAGSLVAWSALLGAYSATVQYEVTVAFLLFWATYCLLVPSLPDVRGVFFTYVCGAVLLLAATLSRETVVAALPVLLLVPAWNPRLRKNQKIKAVLVVGLITCVGLGACTAWRFHVTRRVIPISEKGDIVLQFANNPLANGTFNYPQVGMGSPAGWPFIASHPLTTLKLGIRKAGYFWGILYDGWNVPRPAGLFLSRASGGMLPHSWSLVLARGGVMAALAVAGGFLILRSRRLRAGLWPILLVVITMMSVHLLYLSSCRFSIPSLPLILMLCAVPIGQVVRSVWSIGWRTRSLTVAAGVVFLGAGILGEPIIALTLEAEDFLDSPARAVADQQAINRAALQYSSAPPWTRVLFVPPEMIARGFGEAAVVACASSADQDAEFELRLMAEDAGALMTISRARLVVAGDHYRKLSVPFYCPKDLPVSLAIISIRGGASLDRVTLRAALRQDEPQAASATQATVLIDSADNLQTGRNTGYGWGDVEDWKEPGTVQWALGRRSFLYCSGTSHQPRRLLFRASAFGPLGSQSVTVRFNDHDIATLPLGTGWREHSVCLPPADTGRKLDVIEFRHSAARSPFELDMSPDPRKLAAAYQAVRIVPGCSEEPGTPRQAANGVAGRRQRLPCLGPFSRVRGLPQIRIPAERGAP